jgi:hypothetical protein
LQTERRAELIGLKDIFIDDPKELGHRHRAQVVNAVLHREDKD